MAENLLSKLTVNGIVYNLKDAWSREKIAELEQVVTGGVVFIGITTTALSDGATTNPITINGASVTAKNGSLTLYENGEFLFVTDHWVEVGDLSILGALAYKDSASATYTPAGTVSQPTFSGVSMTSTGNFTPTGSVEIEVGSGSANYTPAGTVSQPTFNGASLTSTGSFTPAGNVAIEVGNGTANYTPAGSVSKPAVTVTPTNDNVYSITDVGTLPVLHTEVSNENLTITFIQGTLPTKGSAQSVLTAVSAALAAAPSFTGTGVDLEASFTGAQGSVSVSGTPTGTVSQPTFSGAQDSISVSGTPEGTVSQPTFSGTQGSLSVSGTPSGTVSQPSFTGTGVALEADFTGTAGTVSVTGTPAGTVSQPTFTGTEAEITSA